MSKLKKILLLSLTIIFLLELISYSVFKFNLLEISHIPKLYLDKGFIPNDEWWIEDNPWDLGINLTRLLTKKEVVTM